MALAWPGRDEHRTLLFQLGRLRKSQRQSNTATSATSAITVAVLGLTTVKDQPGWCLGVLGVTTTASGLIMLCPA